MASLVSYIFYILVFVTINNFLISTLEFEDEYLEHLRQTEGAADNSTMEALDLNTEPIYDTYEYSSQMKRKPSYTAITNTTYMNGTTMYHITNELFIPFTKFKAIIAIQVTVPLADGNFGQVTYTCNAEVDENVNMFRLIDNEMIDYLRKSMRDRSFVYYLGTTFTNETLPNITLPGYDNGTYTVVTDEKPKQPEQSDDNLDVNIFTILKSRHPLPPSQPQPKPQEPSIPASYTRLIPTYDDFNYLINYKTDYGEIIHIDNTSMIRLIAKSTIIPSQENYNSILERYTTNDNDDNRELSLDDAGYILANAISKQMETEYWTRHNIRIEYNSAMRMYKGDDVTHGYTTYMSSRANTILSAFPQLIDIKRQIAHKLMLNIITRHLGVNWYSEFMLNVNPHFIAHGMIRLGIGAFSQTVNVMQWMELNVFFETLLAVGPVVEKRLVKRLEELITPMAAYIINTKHNERINECIHIEKKLDFLYCFSRNIHLFIDSNNLVMMTAMFAEYMTQLHQYEVEHLISTSLQTAYNEFVDATKLTLANDDTFNSFILQSHDFFNKDNMTFSSFDIRPLP